MASFSALMVYLLKAVFIFTTCFCLVLGYRVLLHPLRKFPGPLLAHLTDCYGTYFALRKDLHLITLRDHRKYGPAIRQGPNKLVFNSAIALRAIHQNERVTKSDLYLCGDKSLRNKSVFVTIDKAAHRSRRKLVGQAISERSMRDFEPVMITQINIFLRQLWASSLAAEPTPVNMSQRCEYLGLDVVGLLSFGYNFDLQTSEKNRFLTRSIAIASWHANVLLQLPLLSWFKTETIMNLSFYKIQMGAYRLLETMIKQRLAIDKDAKHDLYSYVADDLGPGSDQLDQTDLWSEAIFFLQAGGDTTSLCLSATFFYLSRNRRCYERLAEEIRSAFSSGSEIRGGPTLAKCHYLRACIDESLRMSPPAPGTLWREQYQDDKTPEPLIIDGHAIPRGTHFGVNIYALHHNEEYFPDSFSYKPERWINATGDLVPHEAFAAFLVGSRGCAGKAMAYLEASLVLAKTLWYFDFEAAPGKLGEIGMGNKADKNGRDREGEFQIFDIFTATGDGPYLCFHPRGEHWRDLNAAA
ncbi:cytochrome P450 [Whalleya microplaca]|nr:cytochrome P450 [Whalleya microplaca]